MMLMVGILRGALGFSVLRFYGFGIRCGFRFFSFFIIRFSVFMNKKSGFSVLVIRLPSF